MAALLLTMACGCQDEDMNLSLETYRPIQEFMPAYEAISHQEGLQQGQDYDLEETIRVINALELAQVNSENFEEFLDYMARQDYSRVAPDVLDAKSKLLPVLQQIYKLKKENEQLSDVWKLVRGAARGGETLVQNTESNLLVRAMTGDVFAIMGILNGEVADQSVDEAFAQYEADKELKSKILADLDTLRIYYRQYLEGYSTVYRDYMDRYNTLCQKKDKAYLAIYSGRVGEALSLSQDILRENPNNAEAMLIKSMALVMVGAAQNQQNPQQQNINTQQEVLLPDSMPQQEQQPLMNNAFRQAQQTLDNYKQMYPSRTAPALVLEGLLQQQLGHEQAALNLFDLASKEYPLMANHLKDVLDSYNTRTYLHQTPEGQYLRRLYASTMVGDGLFSPDFLEAKHYADRGDMQKSKEQIFQHFYRRSSQGVYDNMLSDMQFCEENLYGPFRDMMLENSYLDIEVEPESEWLFWNSDTLMQVRMNNRSDKELQNVRVFLCIHYTDMYQDEYDVVKAKTVNAIPAHQSVDLGSVALHYGTKTYDDIVHIRAIIMTDDNKIGWVDDVRYKKNRILANLRGDGPSRSEVQERARQEYMSHYSLDPQHLKRTIKEGIRFQSTAQQEEKGWWDTFIGWFGGSDGDMRILLPRVLCMTNPVFSLNPIDQHDAVAPKENELDGISISLTFDEPTYGETSTLYIYTEVGNFKVDFIYNADATEVQSVDII